MRITYRQLRQGLCTAISRHDLIPSGSQTDGQQPQESRIIIDQQDCVFWSVHTCTFYVPLSFVCSFSMRLFSISLIFSIFSCNLRTFFLSSCNFLLSCCCASS